MATITIKGIPEDLHRQLKEHAKENGRSLNQEIVQRLRVSATLVPSQDGAADAYVRELRRQQRAGGFRTTPEEIEEFIREGRE